MIYIKALIIVIVLSFSTTIFAATENSEFTTESQTLLSELQTQIKGTLLAVADNENNAGKNMADFHFSVEIPAQQVLSLGLVLDGVNSSKGYQVLSVTPGSTAEKLAIKSGDQLLAINDIELNKSTGDAAISQLHQLVAGQELKLALNSDGNYKEVSTKISAQYVPEIRLEIGSQPTLSNASASSSQTARLSDDSEACGEVSTFFTPPATQYIYPAAINKIDENHRKRNFHSFRLPVGKHTVFLHEYIDDSFYNIKRKVIPSAKSIEIDVKANTTYYLGAKFIKENRTKTFKEEYWVPVVWKTSQKDCQL